MAGYQGEPILILAQMGLRGSLGLLGAPSSREAGHVEEALVLVLHLCQEVYAARRWKTTSRFMAEKMSLTKS